MLAKSAAIVFAISIFTGSSEAKTVKTIYFGDASGVDYGGVFGSAGRTVDAPFSVAISSTIGGPENQFYPSLNYNSWEEGGTFLQLPTINSAVLVIGNVVQTISGSYDGGLIMQTIDGVSFGAFCIQSSSYGVSLQTYDINTAIYPANYGYTYSANDINFYYDNHGFSGINGGGVFFSGPTRLILTPSFLSNYTVDGIPEPSSWALFILGFGAIGTHTRFSRKARERRSQH